MNSASDLLHPEVTAVFSLELDELIKVGQQVVDEGRQAGATRT